MSGDRHKSEPRLRCFVAMAVGRNDTDRIYDRLIRPTLAKCGIHAVFMGKLEHNDDIDTQEIEKANLVIADLTYARPSVYFEAGYAQRKVPVIYTVRKDHFQAQPNDAEGNLRVHFDLQMRNIIPWRDTKDFTFAEKLKKRIALVTRPLLRTREIDQQLQDEHRQFKSLSVHAQNAVAFRTCIRVLKGRGYRRIVTSDDHVPWAGMFRAKSNLHLCVLWPGVSFTQREVVERWQHVFKVVRSRFPVPKNDLRLGASYFELADEDYVPPTTNETRNIKQVSVQAIFCALNKIPRNRVSLAIPALHNGETAYRFINEDHTIKAKTVRLSISIRVLDDIRSERDISIRAKQLLNPE